MKTYIGFTGLLTLLLFGMSFSVKAQTYTLTNNLGCTVELFYEARDAGCFTPFSGPIIITPGNSTTINVPPNVIGGCLIIQQIGGVPAPGNHLWIRRPNSTAAPCHNVSYGQSGNIPNCVSSPTYTVSLTPNSWTIN